jgi:serine/threonine-protein kinase
MGVVYKAFDPVLELTVALKVLSALDDGSLDARERLMREARAAGRLTHRNIIVIHDFGEEQGHHVSGKGRPRRLCECSRHRRH